MQKRLLEVGMLQGDRAATGRMGRCGWRFKQPERDRQKEEEQQKKQFLLLMDECLDKHSISPSLQMCSCRMFSALCG